LRIPATALVFGAHGMRVAALDASGKVVMKPVTLGRNLGNRVEVESGVSLADRLIDNPPESTETGELVQVAGEEATPPVVAAAKKADSATSTSD
jgi:hypothetical protein